MNETLSAWPNGVCKEPIRTSAKLGVSLCFDQSKGELIFAMYGKSANKHQHFLHFGFIVRVFVYI